MAEPTDTERLDFILEHGLTVVPNRYGSPGHTVTDMGCGCCAEYHSYEDAHTKRAAIDEHMKNGHY